MKTVITLALFSIGVSTLPACNNSDGNEVKTDEPATNDSTVVVAGTAATDTTISGCYSMTMKKDTANLQIEVKGANVTGPLSYQFYQKDRNTGSFQGEINGDLLTGWYLFSSEGMMSVRQVAWKIRNGRLWPAMGEMKERNDSALFVNPGKLQYDSVRAFVKIKCII